MGFTAVPETADPAPTATGTSDPPGVRPAGSRSTLRAVAVPTEHGGWGLVAEPGVLGLLVVPSVAGAALAVAGVLAFMARTPLKLAVVDHRRGRTLARTRLARRVVAVEAVVLLGLAAVALLTAGPGWVVPLTVATPLWAVELWFDVRSRSRRLVPELCGAVGASALATAVVLAGDGPVPVAVAVWLVLAGRAVAAVPYVRTQVVRLHRGRTAAGPAGAVGAQAVGVALAAGAVVVEPAALAGAVAVTLAGGVRLAGLRHGPMAAVRLGAIESVLGLVVVIATAVGLHLGGAL